MHLENDSLGGGRRMRKIEKQAIKYSKRVGEFLGYILFRFLATILLILSPIIAIFYHWILRIYESHRGQLSETWSKDTITCLYYIWFIFTDW